MILAYMQRIMNGGGQIEREYGIGKGRIDVRIHWPYDSPTGKRRSRKRPSS